MSEALTFAYWFWPHLPRVPYSNPKIMVLLAVCFALIVAAVIVSQWRRHLKNPITRKLTRSWPTALTWFGITGVLLVVGRTEEILFLAMRVLWVVWLVSLAFYVVRQLLQFRAKHYTILPREVKLDERDPYLPKKKH